MVEEGRAKKMKKAERRRRMMAKIMERIRRRRAVAEEMLRVEVETKEGIKSDSNSVERCDFKGWNSAGLVVRRAAYSRSC